MTDARRVLATATQRAGHALGLSTAQTAAIVGCTLTDFTNGLDPQSEPGRRALILIRIYQSLEVLVGGDSQLLQQWMTGNNQGIQGVPSEQIQTPEGMATILSYLEAMRQH